jgi:hypothetical protein
MTKSEAGRLGGKALFEKHGSDHMRRIGTNGAIAFWKRYTIQPVHISGWAIVYRDTMQIKTVMSGNVHLDAIFARNNHQQEILDG